MSSAKWRPSCLGLNVLMNISELGELMALHPYWFQTSLPLKCIDLPEEYGIFMHIKSTDILHDGGNRRYVNKEVVKYIRK